MAVSFLSPAAPSCRFVQIPDPDCLSDAERERMAGFSSPMRRAQFLLGRTALRTLCGQILSCPPCEVPLLVLPNGAPALEGRHLLLSLSHSAEGALAAAATVPVGCDLEAPPHRPRDVLALAQRFFSPDEAARLGSLEPSQRHAAFLAQWTRKEAAYKSGAVDWPVAVATPWQDGDNPIPGGCLRIGPPEGLPEGWTARIALHFPG